MICKNCGNQLNENAMFCPKCGHKTEKQMQGTEAAVQSNTNNKNITGNVDRKETHKKKHKMPIIIAIVVVIIGLLKFCGSANPAPTNSAGGSNSVPTMAQNSVPTIAQTGESVSAQDEIARTLGKRGTNLTISPDGKLSITRITDSIAPMETPNDGIWTVFVYMCGSNLEAGNQKEDGTRTGGSFATHDLEEMISATSNNSNLRFVVEAGGADVWHHESCADGQNTRLLISEGTSQPIQRGTANMGDPDALFNFLDWGLTNYRSQYTVLDFWDHGGASIGGVCQDDRFEKDSLSLTEIDKALAALYDKYAFKFEMIGCDACLMSTIETANILAPYANYMIASEETEPGTGWDYAGFGNGVREKVKNGAELGKYLCDAYISSVSEDTRNAVTLSVIDLSKIDQFLLGFNAYCIEIYDYICNQNGVDDIMSGAGDLPRFGWDPRWEYHANSTDLGLFLKSTSAYSDKAESVMSLMDECVVYMRNGNAHNDVGGIAIYFPLVPRESQINKLKDICVTPFYMGIVDVCAYGKDNAGDIDGYDPSHWVDEDSEYWSENDVDSSEYDYWTDDSSGTPNTDTNQTGISFSIEPHCEKGTFNTLDAIGGFIASFALDENLVSDNIDKLDKYTFTFSDEGLKKVDTVYTNLLCAITDSNERAVLMDFGMSFVGNGEYYRQNNQKTVEQPFLGMTAGLDNGDILAFNPLTRRYVEGYGYVNFYYAPVKHNGESKYLIFYEYYIEQDPDTWIPTARMEYIAVGTVNTDSGDFASRVEPLKKDDSLVALYPTYDADTFEFVGNFRFTTDDDAYVCQEDGDFRLRTNLIYPEGTYKWMYYIKDIYGNSLYTTPVTCTVDHNQLWPYSIDD